MRRYLEDDHAIKPGDVPLKRAEKERTLGLYRTLIALGSATLTVVVVICIALTSGSYNETVDGAHKAIVIVVDKLHPDMVEFAAQSNKAPFLTELVSHGSVFGSLALPDSVQDQLAAQQVILTGRLPTQNGVFSSNDFNKYTNTTSFLRLGRNSELRTTTIAPEALYSGSEFTNGRCNRLGVLDAECVGLACPGNDTDSYCNAAWRFKTAEDSDENTRNEDYIFERVLEATSAKMDLIYIDLSNFAAVGSDLSTNNLMAVSEMYVTDTLVGRIASLLASRSGTKSENWLLFVTSDGNNNYRKAPYFISNFKSGAPAVVTQPAANATLLDVYPTVVEWFGLSPLEPASYNGTILGVCSKNGRSVVQGC